jgi:hypothetical protein
MSMTLSLLRATDTADRPAYSIATLVNDEAQYAAMRQSFEGGGFASGDTEYLAARGATSAYGALNALLDEARSDIVILCHQDVRLIAAGRGELDQRIGELSVRAPDWALAGNAGGVYPGRLAMRISDPHGSDRTIGELPARVQSLDENFIVLRRKSGVRFSNDLSGFHLYGADICLVADVLGWSAYVIDFHLQHLSPGRKDASFQAAERAFRAKWSRALRPRWVQTTCTLIKLSGSPMGSALGELQEGPVRRLMRRWVGGGVWGQRPVDANR